MIMEHRAGDCPVRGFAKPLSHCSAVPARAVQSQDRCLRFLGALVLAGATGAG